MIRYDHSYVYLQELVESLLSSFFLALTSFFFCSKSSGWACWVSSVKQLRTLCQYFGQKCNRVWTIDISFVQFQTPPCSTYPMSPTQVVHGTWGPSGTSESNPLFVGEYITTASALLPLYCQKEESLLSMVLLGSHKKTLVSY